jgi:hypothetical protein
MAIYLKRNRPFSSDISQDPYLDVFERYAAVLKLEEDSALTIELQPG